MAKPRSPATTPGKRADSPRETLYDASGGLPACRRLSERFHDRIAADPLLRPLFPRNLAPTTEHLALFVAERLGGPADYTARRGRQSLVCRHAHVPIGTEEAARWLGHMAAAMDEMGLPEPAREWLRDYFAATAPTLADPFLPLYHLPLDELSARLDQEPALAVACDRGRSLLSAAAGAWDAPRVRLLLEHGAGGLLTAPGSPEPLYRAANAVVPGREAEGRAVVALLLEHGADVNGRSHVGRMTPLHMAARRGTAAVAEALLAAGADVEAPDAKGETPLRRAVNCGQEGVARLLLRHGADPLSRDKHGRTPLDAARSAPIREALGDAAATRVG